MANETPTVGRIVHVLIPAVKANEDETWCAAIVTDTLPDQENPGELIRTHVFLPSGGTIDIVADSGGGPSSWRWPPR